MWREGKVWWSFLHSFSCLVSRKETAASHQLLFRGISHCSSSCSFSKFFAPFFALLLIQGVLKGFSMSVSLGLPFIPFSSSCLRFIPNCLEIHGIRFSSRFLSNGLFRRPFTLFAILFFHHKSIEGKIGRRRKRDTTKGSLSLPLTARGMKTEENTGRWRRETITSVFFGPFHFSVYPSVTSSSHHQLRILSFFGKRKKGFRSLIKGRGDETSTTRSTGNAKKSNDWMTKMMMKTMSALTLTMFMKETPKRGPCISPKSK